MIELPLDFRRLKFKAAAMLASQILEELEPEEGFSENLEFEFEFGLPASLKLRLKCFSLVRSEFKM